MGIRFKTRGAETPDDNAAGVNESLLTYFKFLHMSAVAKNNEWLDSEQRPWKPFFIGQAKRCERTTRHHRLEIDNVCNTFRQVYHVKNLTARLLNA
jgi:hypothetical protein